MRGIRADEHERPARLKELEHPLGHDITVHPMERLREGRVTECAKTRGQRFSSRMDPPRMVDSTLGGEPLGLQEHPGIGIDADYLREQLSKEQRDRARPATDVDEAG